MIENSRESVTYRLHAIPTLPSPDQIVPSADVVFSLLFLSLLFSSLIFITSDLASKDSRELFRIFRGFLSLSLDLSNFVYFFILAYGDSRGFFLIFVELDLFDRQFSFSRWLSFIRIVDNFSSFFCSIYWIKNEIAIYFFSFLSMIFIFLFIGFFEIIFESFDDFPFRDLRISLFLFLSILSNIPSGFREDFFESSFHRFFSSPFSSSS